MTTLVWNLEENATRRHLLAEALLQLSEERRAQVRAAAEAAGVPEGHHHDLGAVMATVDALDASERAKFEAASSPGTITNMGCGVSAKRAATANARADEAMPSAASLPASSLL